MACMHNEDIPLVGNVFLGMNNSSWESGALKVRTTQDRKLEYGGGLLELFCISNTLYIIEASLLSVGTEDDHSHCSKYRNRCYLAM